MLIKFKILIMSKKKHWDGRVDERTGILVVSVICARDQVPQLQECQILNPMCHKGNFKAISVRDQKHPRAGTDLQI